MAIVVGPTQWHFNAGVAAAALGSSNFGGYVICKSGGTAWIVAPASTEVSRTWTCRDDAVTTANANAACGDWFIPTYTELSNPGYTCRTYWDSYSSAYYWSRSIPYGVGWAISMANGSLCQCYPNSTTLCVRAFRCVIY